MDNDTQNVQPVSDLEKIKGDLKSLYSHVGAALGKRTDEARVKWGETKVTLEARRSALEEKAARLAKAGNAASADMKTGFNVALTELKKAFSEAKRKFDSEE